MARLTGSLWSVPAGSQRELLAQAVAAGIDAIHWDTTDGIFAAEGGFSAEQARQLLDGLAVESEAHLMLSDPLPRVGSWAGFCALVIVPVEAADPLAAMRAIEAAGSTAALAVSPDTDLGLVPAGDFPVLVMSVRPGQAGAPLDPRTFARVRQLSERGRHSRIGVDGGVAARDLARLSACGADWVVSGTALFGASDQRTWLEQARRSMAPHHAGPGPEAGTYP